MPFPNAACMDFFVENAAKSGYTKDIEKAKSECQKENKEYIGKDVAKEAVKRIKKEDTKEKEDNINAYYECGQQQFSGGSSGL